MEKIITLIISLVLLAPIAFTYDNDNDPDPGVEPKYYDDAKVMRVKHTQGEAYVKRSYDDGFEEAAVNLPIFEKDTAGTTDGRMEVYMGRLNYLRLDYDTEVVFDKVPALRKTDLSLKVLRGGIYLDIENLDYKRDIEVQTPDCGVFLLGRGAYRINVSEGGQTEVYVFDGIAEVAGDNYSRNVRENQKIVMFNGQVKERPFYFYSTDRDDFNRWNQDRTSELGYARYGSSQYLDSSYEEYEHELSLHGRWRYNDTYNTYIWIPYNVGNDWRPYYHGRWIWNPLNPNHIKMRLLKNPLAIRSKNIPAAVHLPGTKQKQKVNIVPVPVPVLHLLPGTNQKLKNLHLNPVLLNLRSPGNPLVPKQ